MIFWVDILGYVLFVRSRFFELFGFFIGFSRLRRELDFRVFSEIFGVCGWYSIGFDF